jgi:hypothetical protein
LTFPHDRLSARRDQKKYLALIRAVALVHQHQRQVVDGATVLVAPEDIRIANRLATEALGQSLLDLSAPSRRLLIEIREWLKGRKPEEARFTRRRLREHTGWKRTQLEHHLRELVRAEYVLLAQGGAQGRLTEYRLDWDGKQGMDGERFVRGLIDAGTLEPVSGTCRPPADKSKPRRNRLDQTKGPESQKLVGLQGENEG